MQLAKTSLLFLFVFACSGQLLAQNSEKSKVAYPVPSGNPNQLFYLQRTENINTVIYEWNEENETLNTTNPIRVFWILYAKNGEKENLSGVEKEFVYGIKLKPAEKDQYQFTLAAYPKITLTLMKGPDQKYHVYLKPVKQEMILNKVYIKEKSRFLKVEPSVEYIEFTGTDLKSGKEVIERINP